jgi:ABC-2 type transport system ATP-binding protein
LAVVSVEGLSKMYGGRLALDSIDLALEEGDIMGLIGPNGSGKSTLLRVISGLARPDSGKISLFDGARPKDALAHIGTVLDRASHWDRLTAFENAWFFARSCGLSKEEAISRLEELFAWSGLSARQDDPVSTYSYGMRRKLSLIEALVHRPSLLLLDEPSMGLDYSARLDLYNILKAQAKEGRAVMLATNDMVEASAVCSQVALLKCGRILATGWPEDLVESLAALARVELRLAVPMPIGQIMNLDGVEEGEVRGNVVHLLVQPRKISLASVIEEASKLGWSVVGVDIKQPGLEDVFLKLAGDV